MTTTPARRPAPLPRTLLLLALAAVPLALPVHAADRGAAAASEESQAGSALTIAQAVAEARRANLGATARRFDIDAARADLRGARARPNPEIDVEAVQLDRRLGRTDDTERALGLRLPLEGPGKRRGRIAVAQRGLAVARHEVDDFERELVYEVQSASLDVLLLKSRLDLARESLRGLEEVVRLNEARFRAGDIAGIEFARSRLAMQQFRNEVRSHEVELLNAREALRVLLGRDEQAPLPDVRDDFREPDAPPALQPLLEQALLRRPDYLAAREEHARALADVRLQQAERWPNVEIGAETRRFQDQERFVGVFVSVPLPVFERNQGELGRARVAARRAETELRALEALIRAEVRIGFAELRRNRELIGSLQSEMLGEARRIRDATEVAYRRGEASLLELLDANMAFNETMETWYEARAEQARSLYLLDSLVAGAETR